MRLGPGRAYLIGNFRGLEDMGDRMPAATRSDFCKGASDSLCLATR
jgi:hypothetical protein